MENIVLYCGMAEDILTPLMIVPDVDLIIAISKFDSAYSPDGTWRGQQEEILKMLKCGNDAESYHTYIANKPPLGIPRNIKLPYVIDNITETDYPNEGYWEVNFLYNNKLRILRYYHHTNYYNEWNSTIRNINHLMFMGASFDYSNDTLVRMIEERISKDGYYYTSSHCTGGHHTKTYVDKLLIGNYTYHKNNISTIFSNIGTYYEC